MIDIFRDPLWEIMDAWANYPFAERKIENTGLKSVVKRPHNLIDIKDDNGEIVGQRLEVVTTPFKKDDVKLHLLDNILSVECGSENIVENKNEDIIYHGISSQSYSFSLKLSPSIDQSKITAENKDGILKISLPMKKLEKKETKAIDIKIA